MHSLLWPDGEPGPGGLGQVGDAAMTDLELDRLADRIAQDRPDRRFAVRSALGRLPLDPAAVQWRAGVSRDLLDLPALWDGLREAASALRVLFAHRPQAFPRDTPRAARLGTRVVELESYVDALRALSRALGGGGVRARALRALAAEVTARLERPETVALMAALPHWRQTLDEVRSILIAVNVSPAMEPEAAAIIGFERTPAAVGETALARLLGEAKGERGVARLRQREPVDWQGDGPLAREVRALLETVAAPVERALHGFRLVEAQELAHLEGELVLFLGATALARQWRARGLPVCVAEVGAEWTARDAYHPVLAEQLPPGHLVPNAVEFGPAGSVWVLTGPNRGGKTTYLRTVGAVQVLGQCGLPVPAAACRLSLADQVLTHFSGPELGQTGRGRLDEEAAQLAEIFARCTPASLVLLNEALAGTSAAEGVALAQDVLGGFRALGARVVYATHLHELAARAPTINAAVPGQGTVASLTVAAAPEAGIHRPTYRVAPGVPSGASWFASHIAREHGISLGQLLDDFRARGLLPPPPG